MNNNLLIILFAAGAVSLTIAIILGQLSLKKKRANEAKKLLEIRDSLKSLDGRLNFDEFESELKKTPPTNWDKSVQETIEKFEQIDGLIDIKEHISNYDVVIKQLEAQSPVEAKKNIWNARKQVKEMLDKAKWEEEIVKKYGKEIAEKIFNHDYFLGMTEEQLIDCKGKPTKIEQEVLKTKTKVTYIYGNKNSGDVFTFVNGELERFKDR